MSRFKFFTAVAAAFLAIALAAGGYLFLQRGSVTGTGALRSLVHKKPIPTPFGWPAQIGAFAGGGGAALIDGPSGQARFSDPFGVVLDKQGNVYVADAGENNRIRKITPQGIVSTFAGSKEGYADGVADAAAFNTPSGLAIDAAGNIYVADTGNNRIRKITPQGLVSTIAGNGQAGYLDGMAKDAQFNGPIGVAVDKSGKVYVADTYNDRIRVITQDGHVETVAGGARPGYQDGDGASALFDTPSAIVVNSKDELFVADTRNNAIRKISKNAGDASIPGATLSTMVSTIVRTPPEEREAMMKRPIGLALTHDDFLYIGEMTNGRILQISPTGEMRGLVGIDIDIVAGDSVSMRLQRPVGIAVDQAGSLVVADATRYAVRKITPKSNAVATTTAATPLIAEAAAAPLQQNHVAAAPKMENFPWPLQPQDQPREVVGTIGEVRGNYEGESRDHFHHGVDVQAAMGELVLAVANEKVSSPLPAWGASSINEGMRVATTSYIHMRVGRSLNDAPLDNTRFTLVKDDKGQLAQVRIKRGTKFHIGDKMGTVNRMYHVHLNYNPDGDVVNPLSLSFIGFKDEIAPRINGIQILDQNGKALGKNKRDKILLIPRSLSEASIVVDAYDQADGNADRRRLGLYKVGYQILNASGTPLAGYEQPRVNLEFNRLPADDETVKIAYAGESGITVHGNATTRFLYNVTNIVRDGYAKSAFWQVKELPPGDYLIRIFAADYAGNQAMDGRDLAIRVE